VQLPEAVAVRLAASSQAVADTDDEHTEQHQRPNATTSWSFQTGI
jgi:hypothetical protein